MRKMSLLLKLIITFTIILGIVLICLAWILSMWFKVYYFKEKRTQFEQCISNVPSAMLTYKAKDSMGKGNEKDIDRLQTVVDALSGAVNAEILISDKDSSIILCSKFDENKKLKVLPSISKENMNSLLKGKSIEYVNDHYTYIYPILKDNEFQGYMIMTTPLSEINGQLHKIYLIIWISALIAMIFASSVLSLFSKKILINPLAEINNAAKGFANGKVNKRVYVKSQDEIGQLADSFNIMAESLEKVENNRREFISNVSHELRSPITSIKGFIAGIIDGVIPKDKEGYYLERVYSEIQRLTRLINDLLDLSAIESGKLKFHIRKIDINELIRLCVINNETKIKEKAITLKVKLLGQNCYVSADEDKTMQVITNLLDNAIKYCGNKGNIRISIFSRGPKVFVEIYNDGPKIKDEEIRHIWDRFYKSDKSRTNKVSSGLGLSIVRMILMQQGEEIWTDNNQDIGVSFTFSLTKYSSIKIK
ncbi:sensor histidine kinase [Clostridium saccharobutylicum]|uniref:histidine kinase n=1 Tax=Clostridium saccharobutylicum TaxID=169679 RepID=A0A1S8N423_CLOSA|nr:HAMP domain-containing sensor histidine kinase [Clostridium saccharobutylicum]OOM11165.1 signal transduction histidine-protein kinase BaeS [Clostridium saccharobutylicum]